MRARRYFAAVDSHTEGMPTRVVTGGVGPIPGATMLERKLHFETHMDELRQLLMREPRGHGAMSGAILQPPARPVEARGRVEGGRARSVTLRNVPSFLLARDRTGEVPGLGTIAYDMAYG